MAESRPASTSERTRREPPAGPLGADPEAVAAARDATVKLVVGLGRAGARLTRAFARGMAVAARWTWPHLRLAAIVTGRATARASVRAARWCWTQKVTLARVGHRLLWWTALALLVLVGRALFVDGGSPLDELWLESTFTWFVLGLAMAGVVLLTAPETRMRRAAFALAGSHGAMALLVWFAGV
jgi:hypothetical protein